jgi:hypothetical protein
MTDTIYTPHEMLGLLADYITARRAKYDALCAEIDALCAERDICNSEISAAFSALASF